MSVLIYLLIFIFLLILAAVAGVYAIMGEQNVQKNAHYADDSKLQRAHKYLLIAGVIAWVIIGLVIILIGVYLFFGGSTILYTASYVAIAAMVVMGALALTVGILSAIAANDIVSSPNYTGKGTDLKAYHNAIIAAVCGVGAVGIVLITTIIFVVIAQKRKAAKKKVEDSKATYKAEVLELEKQEILAKQQANVLKQQEINAILASGKKPPTVTKIA